MGGSVKIATSDSQLGNHAFLCSEHTSPKNGSVGGEARMDSLARGADDGHDAWSRRRYGWVARKLSSNTAQYIFIKTPMAVNMNVTPKV